MCSSFTEKLESTQYNACLAITGCFRGTSREKLYLELGLESLADRRLSRRLIYFYKIINGFAPTYLSDNLPPQREEVVGAGRRTRPPFVAPFCRTDRYRASFFPFCTNEWNNLDDDIRNLPSISTFKNALLRISPTKRYVSVRCYEQQRRCFS